MRQRGTFLFVGRYHPAGQRTDPQDEKIVVGVSPKSLGSYDPQSYEYYIAMLRVDPGIVSSADAKGASYE